MKVKLERSEESADKESLISKSSDSGVCDNGDDAGRIRSSSSACPNLVPLTDDYDQSKQDGRKFDREHVKQLMARWRSVARRARREYVDPWDQFNIQEFPIFRAKRHRYSAMRKQWTEDFVEVRFHPEPFARGAMRECYRLKKLSSMGGSSDWKHAQNYVAKKYMQNVDRRVLFDDVKLQMDAKLWAEEYNRYNPPKKIDIVQMCVIEMIDLPESPLYHLEHFIEGDYLKYNSNSGFVSKDARLTPQAFSHFTFERSGHQLMVVDIQGVGDLYTDPQIHTVVGTDYGDGNLGTRGMALYLRSHKCNYICHDMDLSEFELSENEKLDLLRKRIVSTSGTAYNRNRLHSENCIPVDRGISMEGLRRVTVSISAETDDDDDDDSEDTDTDSENDHSCNCVCPECIPKMEDLPDSVCDSEDARSVSSRKSRSASKSNGDEEINYRPRKVGFHDLKVIRPDSSHFDSLSVGSSTDINSMNSSRITRDTEKEEFWKAARKMSIPANIAKLQHSTDIHQAELHTRQFSVLGQIHIDLARYHELGRFLEDDDGVQKKLLDKPPATTTEDKHNNSKELGAIEYDKESALFHLEVARKCGVLEAVLTTAQIYLGMPHELLKDVTVDDMCFVEDIEDIDLEEHGSELMESAAEMGDKGAMMFMAKAYETGRRLGKNRGTDYRKAIEWYQRIVGFQDDEDEKENAGYSDPMARHEILAKMAEMYKEGGYGLSQDFERAYNLFTEAAEAAMEAMNGKLANKYYEKAEMCEY
ncbi:unnamed protein product [Caenorhabditis bovis]|uniref:Eukaryotic elongation factor 2 kinase n=1 Tax=Caenorhabditis bovis TaxID=2654633 RepID=A0A8S1F2F4_9PELO|nr:unnamed protein product [Caenorhabditis bovis]